MREILLTKHHIGTCEMLLINPSKIHALNQFRGVIVNDLALISSEFLNSEEKCRELLELGIAICQQIPKKEIKRPLRMASVQLSSVVHEWDLVQKQHRQLLKFTADYPNELQVAHFCLTNSEDLQHDPEKFFDFKQKAILKMLEQFNAEAWLVYCHWFNQECEQVIQTFRPEASEEYQLQALLEDFSHETRSFLLTESQQILVKAMIEEEGAIEAGNDERLLGLEKLVVSARVQLTGALKTQSDVLSLIVEGIQKIEEVHPELLPLKRQAVLLNQILLNHFVDGSTNCWSRDKQLLMMQLLDQELDVLPMICGTVDVERTNHAFDIRLALILIEKMHSFDDLLQICLEWDQKTQNESTIRQELIKFIRRL